MQGVSGDQTPDHSSKFVAHTNIRSGTADRDLLHSGMTCRAELRDDCDSDSQAAGDVRRGYAETYRSG
jgi:hypothetical protein